MGILCSNVDILSLLRIQLISTDVLPFLIFLHLGISRLFSFAWYSCNRFCRHVYVLHSAFGAADCNLVQIDNIVWQLDLNPDSHTHGNVAGIYAKFSTRIFVGTCSRHSHFPEGMEVDLVSH